MRAVAGVGLDAHRICSSEAVEVVRVLAAQIDLHGLEDIADRDTQLPCLGAIDVREQLRHVHLPAGEQARQLRCLGRLGHERLVGGIERVDAEGSTILQFQLEPARRSQALDGRWRKHGDERVLDAAELLVEALGDRPRLQLRGSAIVKLVELGEHDARVGAVREPVDGQARELDRVSDARLLHHDRRHLSSHGLGAIQRGAVRQLEHAH